MGKRNSLVPKDLPTYDQLMWPVVLTLKELGGAVSTRDLITRVAEKLNLPEETVTFRREGKYRDEIVYRINWTKWYLKHAGVIDYQDKLWILEPKGRHLTEKQVSEIPSEIKKAKSKRAEEGYSKTVSEEESEMTDEGELALDWRNELLAVLQNMEFASFERLCQQVLAKSGFEHVTVTQRTNDKGIDGKGILRLNLISFRVLFQAKRYKSSIQGPEIRNFQAAVQGRADKGLFITTGRFTSGAVKEATRDGGTPIELIDGEALCELLKKLSIGVETKMVEAVSVDSKYFDGL